MIYLFYSTDAWHSVSSKELLGVYDDEKKLYDDVFKVVTKDQFRELVSFQQTQGYETNYMIEEFEKNCLIC